MWICALALAAAPTSALQATNAPSSFDDIAARASAALNSDPKAAAALYRQGLALRPDWAEGWFYLGASLYGAREFAPSKDAFKKAVQLAPENGTVFAFLGLAEAELHEDSASLADIRKGEELGLAGDRQFISRVRNEGALVCLRRSDFSAAVEQLRPLTKLGDDSERTIEAFGLSTLGLSEPLEQVPAQKLPLVQLAGRTAWNFYADRASEADALAAQLAAAYPTVPGVPYLCGITVLNRDPEAARRHFVAELRLRPDYVPAKMQIAILDIKAGHPQSAAELASFAVQHEPDNPLGRAILGRALLDMKQPLRAVPQFEAAARLSPGNAQVHFYLQRAFQQLGRLDEARKEKEEFTRLNSSKNAARLDYPADSTGPAANPAAR